MKTAQNYDWSQWKQEPPEQGEQSPLAGGQSYGKGDVDTDQSLIHPFQQLYDFIEEVAIPQLGNTQGVIKKLMDSIPAEFFPETEDGLWPEDLYGYANDAVSILKDWLEKKVPQSRNNMDAAYEDLRNKFGQERGEKKWRELKNRQMMDSTSGTTRVGFVTGSRGQSRVSVIAVAKVFDIDLYHRVFAQADDQYEKIAAKLLNGGIAKLPTNTIKKYISIYAERYGLNPLGLYNKLMALWGKWDERKFDKRLKGNVQAIYQMFSESWLTPDELYELCQQYGVQPQSVISMFRSLSEMDETRWATLVDMVDHYREHLPQQRVIDWLSLLYGIGGQQIVDTYNMFKARQQFG